MLSYRKSQQVSLTEKLKKKNVIHAFGVSGSGTTMARLYHSAFARVVTTPERQRFTIAHLCHSAFARVATTKNRKQIYSQFFASAHSRGLRPAVVVNIHACDDLCHSAFARVATMAKSSQYLSPTLCHSAFARVATKRAILITVRQDLCHSAFVRVATTLCWC